VPGLISLGNGILTVIVSEPRQHALLIVVLSIKPSNAGMIWDSIFGNIFGEYFKISFKPSALVFILFCILAYTNASITFAIILYDIIIEIYRIKHILCNMQSIFTSPTTEDDNDISGKLTYTIVMESIPDNKLTKPIKDWHKQYVTEWRWRFLDINERKIVEISYLKYNSKRMYVNKYGEHVSSQVSKAFDQFVTEEYYVYATS